MKIAQMATIKGREEMCRRAIGSLTQQVDSVHYFPNSPTDGMKFFGLKQRGQDDIIFICDDDILYPPDFVETMLKYLKPGGVYTVMGKVMKPRPIQSYCRDALFSYPTFSDNKELVEVEVPGTCGMVFYHSTCPDLDHTYFQTPNQADIWMAKYCKERNIPCFVIPHKANWLGDMMANCPADADTIWNRFKINDQPLTDLINSFL